MARCAGRVTGGVWITRPGDVGAMIGVGRPVSVARTTVGRRVTC